MNVDSQTNIADPIFLLSFLFQARTAPLCFDSTDANDDGWVDVSDVINVIDFISWVFSGDDEPPPPFAACGQDPTAAGLTMGSGVPSVRRARRLLGCGQKEARPRGAISRRSMFPMDRR